MGLAARPGMTAAIHPAALRILESSFIAPDIYRREDVARRQARIATIVSDQIIPRLSRLHGEIALDEPELGIDDIGELAHIMLGSDLEAAANYISALRDRGLEMETLFVELLEPTARYVGRMWDNDECDFVDVTLCVARLQKLLAIFNCTHEIPALNEKRAVLMAMTPGDQHYFGVATVEKFLRAGGWKVHAEHDAGAEKLAAVAEAEWFAVAGLTLGSERNIDNLQAAIEAIRSRSRNPAIGIMVGGPVFTACPARAIEIGADATAPNAPAAVLMAQKLFDIGITANRSIGHA